MLAERILVLAPHPDDEVLGAGGTIARSVRQGGSVTVVCFVADEPRTLELKDACSVLGVTDVRTVFHPACGWLDHRALVELIHPIESIVDELTPDLVLMPSPHASHQEHRAVAEACYSALRPVGATGRRTVPAVWNYEYSGDHWAIHGFDQPAAFVVLGQDDLDAKVEAMRRHASQVRDVPSERSIDALIALARLRGSQVGQPYAEAFDVRRLVL